MSFFKSRSNKNQNKLPRHVKNLVRLQEKNARDNAPPVKDVVHRFTELSNRARRSFHNDGPGGNYQGF